MSIVTVEVANSHFLFAGRLLEFHIKKPYIEII